RLCTLEDFVHEGGGAPKTVEQVGAEGHEAAAVDVAAQGVDRWQSITRGKHGDSPHLSPEEAVIHDQQGIDAFAGDLCEHLTSLSRRLEGVRSHCESEDPSRTFEFL